MWDILFTGQPQPKSPYIGNYREEMGPLIRDFWNSKRTEIISNAPTALNQEVFDQVMDIVLIHYEAESANTTLSTELRQKNCAQTPCETLGSTDAAAAAQIEVPETEQVGMVDFNCLPADFSSVTNGAISDPAQCLPGTDLEVDFGFDNFDQGYRDSGLVD
jgi:hypothetical protein